MGRRDRSGVIRRERDSREAGSVPFSVGEASKGEKGPEDCWGASTRSCGPTLTGTLRCGGARRNGRAGRRACFLHRGRTTGRTARKSSRKGACLWWGALLSVALREQVGCAEARVLGADGASRSRLGAPVSGWAVSPGGGVAATEGANDLASWPAWPRRGHRGAFPISEPRSARGTVRSSGSAWSRALGRDAWLVTQKLMRARREPHSRRVIERPCKPRNGANAPCEAG